MPTARQLLRWLDRLMGRSPGPDESSMPVDGEPRDAAEAEEAARAARSAIERARQGRKREPGAGDLGNGS